MAFAGFPRNVRQTPVPNPLFGQLLEQIDDLMELKCTLRIIWLIHQKRGRPRFVYLKEVLSDPTLTRSLPAGQTRASDGVRRGLEKAVRRGTLVSATVVQEGVRQRLYALNTDRYRKALAELQDTEPPEDPVQPGDVPAPDDRPNIFSLYEDNIGMLSPMIAEQLKEAEEEYPAAWIEDAFREAVSRNARSWRYISRILQRWQQEGRSDGRPLRGAKEAGYQDYFRR